MRRARLVKEFARRSLVDIDEILADIDAMQPRPISIDWATGAIDFSAPSLGPEYGAHLRKVTSAKIIPFRKLKG
jgi:hypothetical protein